MTRRLAVEIFIILLIGLALGLFGPFGTFAIPLTSRLLLWASFILIGYVIFRPMLIVGDWLSQMFSLNQHVGNLLALSLGSVPMAFCVLWAMSGFDLGRAMASNWFGMAYGQVWFIGFLINGLFNLLFRDAVQAQATAPVVITPVQPPATSPVPFLDRLPPAFGPLLALKSEDHYVRAIGDARDVMILIRLRDAIGELGVVDGLQVHRSWWVARSAIASTRREGRQVWLCLKNGQDVAVARENVPKLRAAGWLK